MTKASLENFRCRCRKPGYCPVFDRRMEGRHYEICRDECERPCPNRLGYLKRWSQLANRIEGLGDIVNLVTRATGIKSIVKKRLKGCGCGSKKSGRHKWLNDKFPLKKKRQASAS